MLPRQHHLQGCHNAIDTLQSPGPQRIPAAAPMSQRRRANCAPWPVEIPHNLPQFQGDSCMKSCLPFSLPERSACVLHCKIYCMWTPRRRPSVRLAGGARKHPARGGSADLIPASLPFLPPRKCPVADHTYLLGQILLLDTAGHAREPAGTPRSQEPLYRGGTCSVVAALLRGDGDFVPLVNERLANRRSNGNRQW